MQAITEERTLWTEGMKALRFLGFTVYPKDHVAFIGRIYPKHKFHVSTEVTHDRKTGKWQIEFCYDYGEGDFKVSMAKKIERIGLKTFADEQNKAYREFIDKYSAEIRIIHNIFLKKED